MLVLIIGGVIILFKKLKFITAFNVSIYLILAVFWICLRVFNEQLIYQESMLKNEFVAPVAIGLTSIVQLVFRYPLARFGQKIGSRKILVVIAFLAFVIFSIPFIITQNNITFILIGMGAGFFASTFGMENLYFSENWSFKHVFITVALISFLPTSGIFVANIFRSAYYIQDASIEGYAAFMRWALFAILFISLVVLALYVFAHKERKETIRKDISESQDLTIGSFKFKDLLRMSVAILFLGLANQIIFRQEVSGIENSSTWFFIYVLISAATIFIALITSLVLIRNFRVMTIINVSRIATFIGVTLGLIMWFAHIHSFWMGAIFIFVFATSVTMYETTLIGAMAHFDQKNKMLVLAIWLTVRSCGYAIGDTAGSVLEAKYYEANNDQISQWLVLTGFIVVILTIIVTYAPHIRKMQKHIYDNVDRYENKKFDDGTRERIWK